MRRGTGGRGSEEKGRKTEEGRVGRRILKVAETGKKRVRFCNILLYLTIDIHIHT